MEYQSKFWNDYFNYYDVLLRVIPYQELFKRIVSHLQVSKNIKLLDLGAGTGNLQAFLPKNIDVISLDNSAEALDRLKTKFPNAQVYKHSITEKLPFKDNEFDRIISNNVLYTLPSDQWDFVISEIKRVSKPQSLIVISNLNTNFKAIKIYKDHIKKSLRNKGVLKTIWDVSSLIYPTIKMIQFNKIINKNNEKGRYSFLNAEEQKLKFEKHDLISVGETEKIYSGQANLNVFISRKKNTVSTA